MTVMASDMARNARKGSKSGVGAPVKNFDAAVRSRTACPCDRAHLHGPVCRNPLKTGRFPAGLLRLSAQIRSDHRGQINGS